MLKPNLLNWQYLIPLINVSENEILQIAHTTVATRLHFANLHLYLLLQTYEKKSSFETGFLQRSLTENIILDLYSALDALGHVINQIYDLNINYKLVSIDHRKRSNKKDERRCMRCKLQITDNNLSELLESTLIRKNSPRDNWYDALVEYRHQIVHRPHFIFMKTIGNITWLPDDPTIIQSKEKFRFDHEKSEAIIPNYTQKREIRYFATSSFSSVLRIIEYVYLMLRTNKRINKQLISLFKSALDSNNDSNITH